jgi:hypothetical protein
MKIEYHDGEVVEMLFDSKLHSYKVGDEIIPNATKILDVISKPALVPWALKVGADWLEKNFFFDKDASSKKTNVYKSRMAIEPLLKGIKSAYRGKSHDALNIGSVTHEWVEAAINWKIAGGEIPKMPRQEEAVNAIHAFQDWVGENVVVARTWWNGNRQRKKSFTGNISMPELLMQGLLLMENIVLLIGKRVREFTRNIIYKCYILRCDKATGKFEAVRSTEIDENFQAFMAAKTLYQRLKKIK